MGKKKLTSAGEHATSNSASFTASASSTLQRMKRGSGPSKRIPPSGLARAGSAPTGGAIVDDVAILRHRQFMATLSTVEKLKLIRTRLKWNAAQAAKAWGLTVSTLRAYESGHRANPTQRRTENAGRIESIIRKEEAFGGVLHHLWRPTTNGPRQPVTKKQIRKSNDSPRSKPKPPRGAGAKPRPRSRP